MELYYLYHTGWLHTETKPPMIYLYWLNSRCLSKSNIAMWDPDCRSYGNNMAAHPCLKVQGWLRNSRPFLKWGVALTRSSVVVGVLCGQTRFWQIVTVEFTPHAGTSYGLFWALPIVICIFAVQAILKTVAWPGEWKELAVPSGKLAENWGWDAGSFRVECHDFCNLDADVSL